MSFDVKSAADQVMAAFTSALPKIAADQSPILANQAAGLAQAVAEVEALRATGRIDDAIAKDLIAAQTDTAQATLQADAGVAELDAGAAVRAGIGALAGIAGASPALGWLAPALQLLAGAQTPPAGPA